MRPGRRRTAPRSAPRSRRAVPPPRQSQSGRLRASRPCARLAARRRARRPPRCSRLGSGGSTAGRAGGRARTHRSSPGAAAPRPDVHLSPFPRQAPVGARTRRPLRPPRAASPAADASAAPTARRGARRARGPSRPCRCRTAPGSSVHPLFDVGAQFLQPLVVAQGQAPAERYGLRDGLSRRWRHIGVSRSAGSATGAAKI